MKRSGKMVRNGIMCFFMTLLAAAGVELPAEALAHLKSGEFRVRESAQAEILAWGRKQPEPAKAELYRLSQAADDPEVRKRCLDVLRELVMDEYGKNDIGGKGYIGISLQDMMMNLPGENKRRNLILVTQVLPKTPAALAGLKMNDLLVELNGKGWKPDETLLQFQEKIQALKPNTNIKLKILRDGKMMDVKVKLGKYPDFNDLRAFNGDPSFDPAAAERAEKETYFRRWLSKRKAQP